MALRILQQRVIDDKMILQPLILVLVDEALLLHAGAVKDVRLGNNVRRELVRLEDELAGADELLAESRREGEGGGGDELDADVVVLEELDERMDGAAVLEVAGEGDGQAGDGAELLADGEEVEEGLGRVLHAAVAAVDDGHRGELGGGGGGGFVRVAEDDGVAVAAEGADAVLEGFAFLRAGVGGGDGDGSTAEALHGGVE